MSLIIQNSTTSLTDLGYKSQRIILNKFFVKRGLKNSKLILTQSRKGADSGREIRNVTG